MLSAFLPAVSLLLPAELSDLLPLSFSALSATRSFFCDNQVRQVRYFFFHICFQCFICTSCCCDRFFTVQRYFSDCFAMASMTGCALAFRASCLSCSALSASALSLPLLPDLRSCSLLTADLCSCLPVISGHHSEYRMRLLLLRLRLSYPALLLRLL